MKKDIRDLKESLDFISKTIPEVYFTECWYPPGSNIISPNQNVEIYPDFFKDEVIYTARRRKSKQPWGDKKPYNPKSDSPGYLAQVPEGYLRIDVDFDPNEVPRDQQFIPERLQWLYDNSLVTRTNKGWHLWCKTNKRFKSTKIDFEERDTKIHIDICAHDRGVYIPGSKKIKGKGTSHVLLDKTRELQDASEELEEWLESQIGTQEVNEEGYVIKYDSDRKYTTQFDWARPEWIIKGTGAGRHDELRDAIFRIQNTTRLTRDSVLTWANYFNELMFEHPKDNPEEIARMVDGGESKRDGNVSYDDILIRWKRHHSHLNSSSGFRREILDEGFELMGMKIRLNMRKDCVEYYKKTNCGYEWTNMSEAERQALTSWVCQHFVSGLNIIPERLTKKQKEDGEVPNWIISSEVSFDWNTNHVYGSLCTHAARNKIDPFIEDVLKELPDWDGTSRIDTLLEDIFHIRYDGTDEENERTREIVRIATKSLIFGILDRTFEPGCKHDEMVVLVSEEQGVGKSSFLKYLIPDEQYFKEGFNLRSSAKKTVEETQGKVLIESAEMTGLDEKSLTYIMSMISTSNQTVRLSYRKDAEDYRARHIFAGTTNEVNFLPYQSAGARRFIPIEVGRGEMPPEDILPDIRDQIWAEAITRHAKAAKACNKELIGEGETGKLTEDEMDIVFANSQDFMGEPLIKDCVNEMISHFKQAGKGRFYEEDAINYIGEKYGMDLGESEGDKREMHRHLRANRKIAWKRSNKSYSYQIRGVVQKDISEEVSPEETPAGRYADFNFSEDESETKTKNYEDLIDEVMDEE